MDYLAILKNLDAGKAEASNMRASVAECSGEKSELSERSPLSASDGPTSTGMPTESAPDPIWTPPLGRENDRGEFVLTVADLPELERRLRLSGWRVARRGNELTCSSRGALKIQ
jgi:hypothetical protein